MGIIDFEVIWRQDQGANFFPKTIANGPKQAYTPRLTCPPFK